jgi:hypothetical protein
VELPDRLTAALLTQGCTQVPGCLDRKDCQPWSYQGAVIDRCWSSATRHGRNASRYVHRCVSMHFPELRRACVNRFTGTHVGLTRGVFLMHPCTEPDLCGTLRVACATCVYAIVFKKWAAWCKQSAGRKLVRVLCGSRGGASMGVVMFRKERCA